MKKIFFFLFFSIVLANLGCNKSNTTPPPTKFHVFNLSPGSQSLDFSVNGTLLKEGLVYGNDTGYFSTPPGIQELRISKTGSTTPVVDLNMSLTAGIPYSIFAIDSFNQLTPAITIDSSTAVKDTTKVRFLNFLVASPQISAELTAGTYVAVFHNRTFNDLQVTNSPNAVFEKLVPNTFTLTLINTSNADSVVVKTFPGLTFSAGKIYTLYIYGDYSDTTNYPINAKVLEHN
jgi:hypothetical protein